MMPKKQGRKREPRRELREQVNRDNILFKEWKGHWSNWTLAMSPKRESGFKERRRSRKNPADPRGNLLGYKISVCDLKEQLKDKADNFACGIYEWMASKKVGRRTMDYVVYIGSTCQDHGKKGNFIKRIMEYCNNGSHKSQLIERALGLGYELWVSFKGSCGYCSNSKCCDRGLNDHQKNRIAAEEDENSALLCYDYAWNVREQGGSGIRDILT